jgi:hypothetical protein
MKSKNRKSKKWPGESDPCAAARVASRAVREMREAENLSVCQNCRKTFASDQLEEITHGFWERVSPGEIVPSGECPRCGALCHPVENALSPFVSAAKKLVEIVSATGGLLKYQDGTIAPAGDPDWIDLGDAVQGFQSLLAGQGVKMKVKTKNAKIEVLRHSADL